MRKENTEQSFYRCSTKKCSEKLRKIRKKIPLPEFLFDKVAAQHPAALLKKTPTQLFLCKFCKISLNFLFAEQFRTTASETADKDVLLT